MAYSLALTMRQEAVLLGTLKLRLTELHPLKEGDVYWKTFSFGKIERCESGDYGFSIIYLRDNENVSPLKRCRQGTVPGSSTGAD